MSATLRLKPGRHRVLQGCPWIFRGELLHHDLPAAPVVDVLDGDGRMVGRGLYSPTSAIAVRIMRFGRGEFDLAPLVRQRIKTAVAARASLAGLRTGLRLVNAEADGLPGLVVDRYGPMVVVEVSFHPMDGLLPIIVEELSRLPGVQGIFERGALSVRRHEALPLEDRLLWGELVNPVSVEEYGLSYQVDLVEGQKTGHYLDQAENRAAVAMYANGRTVLDVFSHTGGFGLQALKGGAASVTAVDSDPGVLSQARENAARNGFADQYRVEEANAFDWLREKSREPSPYDLIVLDPPAFTKSRAAVEGALRGYKEINLRAARMLSPGGVLVSCSCSYHVDLDAFIEVVGAALHDAHREARLVEVRGQPKDHGSHPLLPESRYLKCLVFEMVGA